MSAAATTGARSAVRNGWLPVGTQGLWVINSIGLISHAGQQFAVVVLSDGQPTESVGIGRVQAAARAAVTAVTEPAALSGSSKLTGIVLRFVDSA